MRRPQYPAGRVTLGAGIGVAMLAGFCAVVAAFSVLTGCEINTAGTSIDGCPLSDGVMAAAAVAAAMALLGAATLGPVLLLTIAIAGAISIVRRRW